MVVVVVRVRSYAETIGDGFFVHIWMGNSITNKLMWTDPCFAMYYTGGCQCRQSLHACPEKSNQQVRTPLHSDVPASHPSHLKSAWERVHMENALNKLC